LVLSHDDIDSWHQFWRLGWCFICSASTQWASSAAGRDQRRLERVASARLGHASFAKRVGAPMSLIETRLPAISSCWMAFSGGPARRVQPVPFDAESSMAFTCDVDWAITLRRPDSGSAPPWPLSVA
jgi:hypothetical protein